MNFREQDKDIENRLAFLEENRRFTQNALESALKLGDFQEKIKKNSRPQQVLEETEKRIGSLIEFEARAFCLVDKDDLDLGLTLCEPEHLRSFVQDEIEFMIEKRFMAWAMRECRGVTILSEDQKRQFLLHVIATDSQIRGMFIGLFPDPIPRVPDVSLPIMSIIFRNAANALESIEYQDLIRNQKQTLQLEVDQKTKEILRYERQLLRAQKTEAIATLAGGIAHEFNNALSAVVGCLELFKLDFLENEKVLNDIEYVQPAIDRMSNLTSQLLAYAQEGKYHPQKLSLNDIVQDTLPNIQHTLDSSIKFDLKLASDTWPVDADLLQMQMVLAAMLTNASEALEREGRIRISTRNIYIDDVTSKHFADLSPGRYVSLQIKDNGKGMDEKTRQRLFEPFYTTKIQGRGLGMAAAFGIIRSHDGWIKVDSEIGRGTLITVYLPIAADVHVQEKNDEVSVAPGTETILLVEDDDIVVEITRKMMTRLGYQTRVAQNGEEAVRISDNPDANFDLVLLDMKLPDMDAKQIFFSLKNAHPETKVIIFSGYAIDGPVQEILDAGADGFIQKPFSFSTLSSQLRAVLGNSKEAMKIS
ncbi:MAG: response regulator [Deltaproteobacteria bacterium]|jgi:signal transduction histidine kinase/ActR/RegA family two-component response regulator|nr:response regulator [Deltaproteobacteria bacterium]